MSERESPAAGEAGSDRAGAARPGLFDRLRAVFGLGGASIRDDIQDALADSSTEVDVSPQERTMLKNVLALHEVQVEDVMVPRADIIAVSLDSSLIEVLTTFRTAGHSRLPVHGDTLDDPRGMIHIRDFLAYLTAAIPNVEAPRSSAATDSGAPQPAKAPPAAEPAAAKSGFSPISTYRWRRPTSCVRSCSCRRRCRRSTCSSRCRRRARIWRSSSTNMAAPTASPRSRTSSK